MSYLINTKEESRSTQEASTESPSRNSSEVLHVVTKSVITQESPMSDFQKERVRKNAPKLKELLKSSISNGKGLEEFDMNWTGDTVELKGVSKMDLHSFILKAEELGKNITYTKTYKVSITD